MSWIYVDRLLVIAVMSSDCDRLRFVVTQLNLLWIIPLQFIGALCLVINLLGPAGLMGLVRKYTRNQQLLVILGLFLTDGL